MTEDDKKRSDEINAKIEKINKVTALCDFEQFSSYTIDNIKEALNSISNNDKLYVLWNWGKNDNFVKDSKWVDIVSEYNHEYRHLIEITKYNNDFIKYYIKEQFKTLQDASLELMYLHKDYDNEDLKMTIDKTNDLL